MFHAVSVPTHGHNQRVILLDIPGSIEDAQSLRINGHACRIKSTLPLSQPFPSNEPKGQKLLQALNAVPAEQLHEQRHLESELVCALQACKARFGNHDIPWCLPRVLQPAWEEYDSSGIANDTRLDHRFLHIPIVLSPLHDANRFGSLAEIRHCVVMSPSCSQTILDAGKCQYFIPARAVFVLSTIQDGLCAIHMAAQTFDLILMDPPWSNRSVRRSSAYKTHEDQGDDPFIQALPILEKHLKGDGIVGVWVTNKHAVRTQVVDALHVLGLRLVTAWTWLKVTDQGEPVSDIHGVWRKPYETLLVFSRAAVVIPRHILIAVPDVHSRKPSLKRLLAQYLPASYTALELFARSLTAGWWSLGDQALRFQDTREWELN
jgi:N6-adenosine-specific RNA methylase IME4